MQVQESSIVIQKTERWLDHFIIGLNICPFAKAVRLKKQIRFHVSPATTPEALLEDLQRELTRLMEADPKVLETTLLIHPEVLHDFLDYNDFLAQADEVLIKMGFEGVFQIASFHPEYQFADSTLDDQANFSNRSPYPMLHLLREESVSQAVESYPDVENIPSRNIQTLRQLSLSRLKKILS
jgi:hypothetical protein